ncbi:hypothetical protein F4860DRAFT_451004 [Xylaria cubensis]|nr:hypothetical protein F4860DRAFT_451004 [Xylaria cubensis]
MLCLFWIVSSLACIASLLFPPNPVDDQPTSTGQAGLDWLVRSPSSFEYLRCSAPAYHELRSSNSSTVVTSLSRQLIITIQYVDRVFVAPLPATSILKGHPLRSDSVLTTSHPPRLHCQLGSASQPAPPCDTNNYRNLWLNSEGPEESYLPPTGPSSHNNNP